MHSPPFAIKNLAELLNHMDDLWPQISEPTPGTHAYSLLRFIIIIQVDLYHHPWHTAAVDVWKQRLVAPQRLRRSYL
jgi:hypothetical protein